MRRHPWAARRSGAHGPGGTAPESPGAECPTRLGTPPARASGPHPSPPPRARGSGALGPGVRAGPEPGRTARGWRPACPLRFGSRLMRRPRGPPRPSDGRPAPAKALRPPRKVVSHGAPDAHVVPGALEPVGGSLHVSPPSCESSCLVTSRSELLELRGGLGWTSGGIIGREKFPLPRTDLPVYLRSATLGKRNFLDVEDTSGKA